MRKIPKIESAQSLQNGICYHSKKHKGYMVCSLIDENGEITVKWQREKDFYKEMENQYLEQLKRLFKSLIFLLPILIISCIFINLTDLLKLEVRIIFFAFFITSLCTFISIVWLDRKYCFDMLKFHSAEHMSINAYKKLKRVPTLEEIKQFSRFNSSCGTNFTFLMILMTFIIFCSTFIQNVYWLEIGCVLCVISFITVRLGMFNLIQIFTTTTPTDREIQVAYEGIKLWYQYESEPERIIDVELTP